MTKNGQQNIIYDNHGRPITYLRLSVTDRCNLRCAYCMPEEGIDFNSRDQLLNLDQLYELVQIFTGLGIEKIRITGGEPFVRNELIDLLEQIAALERLKTIGITSNGVLMRPYLHRLKRAGIENINLSLDSLDRQRYALITRRDKFREVYKAMMQMIEMNFNVKINCVVMDDKNIEDIIPLVEFTREHAVTVRFIEEMPFNGNDPQNTKLKWDYRKIYQRIAAQYPEIETLNNGTFSTSTDYKIKGHQGAFGIIPAFSRTFCGTCNRVRVAADGAMRTCLYGPPVANLKKVSTKFGAKGVREIIIDKLKSRAKNGFEAEKRTREEGKPKQSMSILGG